MPTTPSRHPGSPAPAQSGPASLVVNRDAETETLLRTYAIPLFRAAGLDVKLGRNILLSDAAIDSFESTGNGCSSPPGGR